jgi:hypothetical protein
MLRAVLLLLSQPVTGWARSCCSTYGCQIGTPCCQRHQQQQQQQPHVRLSHTLHLLLVVVLLVTAAVTSLALAACGGAARPAAAAAHASTAASSGVRQLMQQTQHHLLHHALGMRRPKVMGCAAGLSRMHRAGPAAPAAARKVLYSQSVITAAVLQQQQG